ncbi:MAG: caspase family protein [Deltaproteobacteria bacterium]|nr:caspase family protein [Deltaproteobacteria bacterium]
MPQAISIHLGLNAVDPRSYRGWAGPLRACENDARAMSALADARGFRPQLLLGEDATRTNLVATMDRAVGELAKGDLLLLTYSGHGASVPDRDGDEPDGRDEAWCLRDGLLLDDEIHEQLCKLAAGVRVLVVSDSCFSGSVIRDLQTVRATGPAVRAPLREARAAVPDRRAPAAHIRAVLRAHAAEYAERKAAAVAATQGTEPRAGIILLAACEDRQPAYDGDVHGRFTGALLAIWDGGAFAGSHDELHAAIRVRLEGVQSPTLFLSGAVDPAFRAGRPFTP